MFFAPRRSIVVPLLALACALAGCSPAEVRAGRARRVILITCDTLRADHLGCYGHARPTTPNTDAFAREAVRYEQAYSCAPMTVPALSALMTGRLPQEVGAALNNRQLMGAEALTIAEAVRRDGVTTAAFVSNGVLRQPPQSQRALGLAQGFEHFDDEMDSTELNRSFGERKGDACAAAAVEWMRTRRRDERIFLWIHFQDPHGPYTPPPEIGARFPPDPREDAETLPVGTSQVGFRQLPAYQFVPEPDDEPGERGPVSPARYRARYEAEIAYFDEQLARVLDEIRARGWWDDSLIVLSADHGESLGEHDHWFCHGESLSRELVRVPLIVKFPAAESSGREAVVEQLVSHLDLWPTILDAFGMPAIEGRGTSLFARDVASDRVAVQTLGVAGDERHEFAVGDGRLRLVIDSEGVEHLFDTREDPGELRDLARERPQDVRALRERGEAFVSSDPRPAVRGAPRKLDAESREALRKLGYTDGR